DETEHLLQPPGLFELDGSPPSGVVPKTIDAAIWAGLAIRDGNQVRLSEEVASIGFEELDGALPRLIRRGLLQRHWPPDSKEAQRTGGDLGLAIAWYLAQSAWDP